jgi:hypothetical protein
MNIGLRAAAVALVLIAAWISQAADAPKFSAEGVVPYQGVPGGPLAPGIIVTIYGERLASRLCSEIEQTAGVYPESACQTVVLAGDKPAQLMFVGTNQINLKLPDDLPRDGAISLRVVREGVSSPPVSVRFCSRPVITLAEQAYVGLPVWLAIELPYPLSSRVLYPASFDPSDFGSHAIEVRKQGRMVPETPLGLPPTIFRGETLGMIPGLVSPADPVLLGRLPLHLKYRLDEPGAYEVRYNLVYQEIENGQKVTKHLRSEWTEIALLPSSPEQRGAWLERMQREAPLNVGDLLCGFLPSLLVQRSPQTFSILSRYFDHPNMLVRLYATNAARLFTGIVPETQMPQPPSRIKF